jgi:hypothetical protein
MAAEHTRANTVWNEHRLTRTVFAIIVRPEQRSRTLFVRNAVRQERRSSEAVFAPNGVRQRPCSPEAAPQTQFQLMLPLATRRGQYLQVGCGGLCRVRENGVRQNDVREKQRSLQPVFVRNSVRPIPKE